MSASLEQLLKGRRVADLQEFHLYWDGSFSPPEARDALIRRLLDLMADEAKVRERWRQLPPRQREVAAAVARHAGFSAERTTMLAGRPGGPLKPAEFEAAANALLKRGFLFLEPNGRGGSPVYTIPEELGRIVRRLAEPESLPPAAVFRLGSFLTRFPTDALHAVHDLPPGADPVEALAAPEAIAVRLAAFRSGTLGALLDLAVRRYGGILPRTLYEKAAGSAPAGGGGGLPRWDGPAFSEALERALLGTVASVSLEAYGVHLDDETLVVFGEVVEADLRAREPSPDAFPRLVDRGVDLLSDLARVLELVKERPFRLTRLGNAGHGPRRRLLNRMLLREEGGVAKEDLLDFLITFVVARRLVTVDEDRFCHITQEGLAFTRRPLEEQARTLFQHAARERAPGERDFHHRELKRILLGLLPSLPPDRWVDPMLLPHVARLRYLAALDETGVRDAYLARFQYAVEPPREEVAALSWRLHQFVVGRLHALGLLELGLSGEEPAAVRLTPFGRRVLGIGAEGGGLPPGGGIVVNPDFEVIVLPEGREPEILYLLGRFGERLQTDRALRFRITRERVKEAVAAGCALEPLLEGLARRCGGTLPQNVAYSLREWSAEVRFVRARKCILIEGSDPSALDQVMELLEGDELCPRRIGPNALALDPRAFTTALVEELRRRGLHVR